MGSNEIYLTTGKEGFISIVIPVRNEEQNVLPLFNEIESIMSLLSLPYEVIFIDDHSKDRTVDVLGEIADEKKTLKLIRLVEGNGKDAALMKGLLESRGLMIITLDGDLQNDPADIPKMLHMLDGYDMVCGVRVQRDDSLLKKIVSGIANWIRNIITADTICDAGCAFRIMRRECVSKLEKYNSLLYDSAHYFYPTLLNYQGYRIKQVPVRHRARKHGKTKFGLMRGRVISGIRACLEVRRIRKEIIVNGRNITENAG